ncbi:MAG: polysaccharide pyruvyl transferase family protein, partial [Anaerolineales bacterium]
MNSTSISPWFWTSDTALWNYGDALSVFLVDELIYDIFPYSATTHIIGSVIFDGILSKSEPEFQTYGKPLYDDRDVKSVFWGCGIRNPGSLNASSHPSVEFLAVRGPVTASDLRLGGTIPQGDPALLLPALYSPRKSPKFSGKTICVPHYNDDRTDEDIVKASGCDVVLRPAVKKNRESIKAFIDAICSAKFVLAGAMHAAVTAAAYGVPFGFWDSGAIDIPTKWEDTAGLLSIPCAFFETLDAASEFYDQQVASAIVIPSLWPLICVAPGLLKGAGMLKVLKYELERSSGKDFGEIALFIEEMTTRNMHHERIAALSNEIIHEYVQIKQNTSDLEHAAQMHLDEK